ncbi:MAG: hypothetical protein K2O18_00200 [Oscillospiraceae bacterium]|nr:hypothetical protein [Oscillospiraceae bacterium]
MKNTEESPYYEAVKYFADQKILTSADSGLPESEITLKEWTGILSRMEGLSENVISACVEAGSSSGTGPSAASLPALIYNSIWQTAGITTYTAYNYGFASDLDAGTTAMLITGLIGREDIGRESISRGEALRLLYEVTIKKTAAEVPANLIGFFEVSTDCEAPEETEALLRKLLEAYPNNQLALLLAYGYRFEIWDDLSSLPVQYSDTLLGLEDDGAHIIYLEKEAVPEWALHETGHAVETCNSSYSATIALNKAEREAGISLLGEYAGVNRSEFIAEAASYFMKNRNNEAALLAMKESMPQTYEHFTKLVSKEPFLSEAYFLNIVSSRQDRK